MDIRKNYRYYVVTFLDPPYSDIDQYVCIPDSWIQLREIVDQVVVAKFPVENSSITNKRVKEGEVFSDDWSIYVAEVKYGTDSYGQAEQYIKTLKKKLINGQSCSGPVNKGNGLSKISESLRRSMRKQSRVNKSQVSETSSNNNMEPLPEQLAVEIETHNKETNGVETINSANEVTNQTDASSKSLNGEQLLSNWENNPDDATVTQENNNDKSNNVDYIDNSNNPDGIAENESSANDDGPFTNESLDPIIISEPISDTGNSDRVKNTSDLNFEESCLSLFDHASDTFFQNCTSMEKLMDIINNYYDIGSYDPIITKIKDTVTPVAEETEREEKECEEKEIEKNRPVAKRTQAEIGIIKRREAERNEQENNDDDDDDDDDYVKRKRFRSRTLILPPEYDKNDSKWTLRYREYAPGLVELIEHTGVYVNAIKLINCKRLAKNSKTLARLLLVEIFTESALFTCSLTGVRAKAFDFDGTHIRPGLDENARTVLLTYVEQHAQANKWAKRDNATILNSIRNKMQEIRSKYNK